MTLMRALALAFSLVAAGPVLAWSPQGHQTVGAIADRLLDGTRAGREVQRILGEEPLRVAALWADCVKSVTERPPHRYVENPRYPECAPFHTADGEREMADYVSRNLSACHPGRGQESCHKQYHYADVAVQRPAYVRGQVGTSDHDIVAAIRGCVIVLRGGRAPSPFDIRSPREALRVLAHLVGDIHQPLHVGAVYLDGEGRLLDPDLDGLADGSDTQGGNALLADGVRFHAQWDAIPARLHAEAFASVGAGLAKAVGSSEGEPLSWAQAWAGETLRISREVHAGLVYGPRATSVSGHPAWAISSSRASLVPEELLKERQLVKAGARLAQLLETIWP